MMGAEYRTRIIAARSGRLALLAAVVLAASGLHPATARSAPAPSAAFVRVNQVGYPSTASKRAFLMASVAETGATFTVSNASGDPVLTAPIGANLGSWSSTFPNVYALDFDTVTTPGSYTISVSGPVPATSPSFSIDTGTNVYAAPLANALSFYQTERDGPAFIPSALRTAPGHLNDQTAMTYLTPHVNPSGRFSGDLTPLGVRVDASGGWWDAGDYIKGVQTLGYTTDPLYRYIRNRPVFRAGAPGSLISPNLAGRSAAAFGLCFQIFKTSDPVFANRCLLAGQHIFDLADTAPTSNLTTYIPFSFYPETEWRSDLELG